MSKTEDKTKSLGEKLAGGIKTAAKWGAGIAAAATAAGAGMMAMAKNSAAAADDVDKMSQKIGISRAAYQELAFACSQSGTDVTKLQGGMKTLTNQMQSAAEGGKTASAAFDALGLSIYDSSGQLKSQEDMMFEAMAALQGVEDQTMKSALATDLFGKAGSELMPMLNGAAGSIDEMREKAHELGLVMSDDTVDAGVAFTDSIDQMSRSVKAIGIEIGAAFMPILQQMLAWVVEHMPEIRAIIDEVIAFIKSGIEQLQAFWNEHGEQISQAVTKVFSAIQQVIERVMGVIQGIIKTVTGIINGDWSLAWEGLRQIAENVLVLIKSTVQAAMNALVNIVKGIGSALYNAGKSIFNSLWDGIRSVWSSISGWVSEKVDWIADKLAFWKSSESQMSKSNVSGSHAAGLSYVPYDGYIAELHRGERVLTASEAKESRAAGGNIIINISGMTVREEADIDRIAQKLHTLSQRAARGRGLVTV